MLHRRYLSRWIASTLVLLALGSPALPSASAAPTASFVCEPNKSAVQPTPVIDEFMAAPPSGTQEWVELYNPTDKAIDISNLLISQLHGHCP